MFRARVLLIGASVLLLSAPIVGQNGNFIPDWTFTGSSLAAWQPLGNADWQVSSDGEIVGTPATADGGWLMLNQSFQDVQAAFEFRCIERCTVGVLLRAERTADGIKGVLVELTNAETGVYAVTINRTGKETRRAPLVPSGGSSRLAPPRPPAQFPPPAPLPGGVPSPYRPLPQAMARPGEWTSVEAVLEANTVRTWINDLRGVAGAAEEGNARFGAFALYIGGSGGVRFRHISLKDVARRVTPSEVTGPRFRTQRIDDFYTGWSAAAGDFNRDGVLDVTAGNRYYLGPDFQESREIYLAQPFNPATEYSQAMVNFAHDYTGDGWDDVLVAESRTPVLYVNPRGQSRRWDRFAVFPPVTSEVVAFRDIDAHGHPDAVIVGDDVVSYVSCDPAAPTSPWRVRTVSGKGPWPLHGIGAGDINGDGRVDIVTPYGWWQQPASLRDHGVWPFHSERFGRFAQPWGPGGAEMLVYDVNGDERSDVVTSLAGHGWGLAWYEQQRDDAGTIGFLEHMVMDDFATQNAGNVTFSQLHGSTMADVDRDGTPDIIVGKRAWAHLESYVDPDPHGPAVLYWYRTVRNPGAPGGAELVPELIHNRSGAGSTVTAVDLNKDGALDVLTATNRGTFSFWGTLKDQQRAATEE